MGAIPDEAWRIEPLLDVQRPPDQRFRGGALPLPLSRRYGTDVTIALRPERPTIVANFVSTLDGVVAFDALGRSGGREVSGGFAPDRFLMGLLRATADVVLVGAGTVRSRSRHVWTPGHAHPPSTAAFATWRRQLGLPAPQPTTVVVTASGRIDPEHPGLHDPNVPVLLLATASGFLTIAPQIAGRAAALPRLALVEGLGYEIGATPWAELRSVMRAGSHLFLRYGLTEPPRHTGE